MRNAELESLGLYELPENPSQYLRAARDGKEHPCIDFGLTQEQQADVMRQVESDETI